MYILKQCVPTFILITTLYSNIRTYNILRGPTILDTRFIYMPVLIGVGGGPTLGQHKYKNRAYFQTPDRYTCQKLSEMSLVIFKVYYIYYKLFR